MTTLAYRVLRTLTKPERRVVALCYNEGLSDADAAKVLYTTPKRIAAIRKRVMDKIEWHRSTPPRKN